jgi:serine/threonine protein kinase
MTSDGGGGATLDPEARAELLDELADTLDAMLDGPIVGAGLFGGTRPAIGRYVIDRRMGVGATSVVYAAQDTVLDRPVALKIMPRRDDDGAWSEHARDEARALARLDHENVVAVYDVGEWLGHPFIAMQLVAGVTLAQWQAARRRTWPEIVRHYLAAARGLDAAHSVGLVHRDFKPANVLVAGTGRVVVTDFGLAALAEPTPAAGAAPPGAQIGTRLYRAPEQHIGVTPRPSADVYSFSVALCEALLGRHPLADAAFDWRRALAQLALPQRARTAIEYGMAPVPAQRWPRLGPLLADLERALPEPPPHAVAPLDWLRCRRRRLTSWRPSARGAGPRISTRGSG